MKHLLRYIEKVEDTNTRIKKLNTSLNKFIYENSELLEKIMTGEKILVFDFLKLYDTRIYDIHSRQNDIKYMKELDFKGLYYIQNLSKKKCYLGSGDNVFRKVDRHFRGYGNQDIFDDYKNKNIFEVSFFKLESSEFDNLNDFEKEIRSRLNITGVGYQNNNSKPIKTKKNVFVDILIKCISIGLIWWLVSMLI